MSATLPSIKNSIIQGTTIRKTSFIGCTLRHADIFGSTISGSILSNVKLSNCAIDGSTLNVVRLTNSTVVSSSLVDSKLHETPIANCSMDNCTMTSSPLAFRKFPPEIRSMIFAGCIDFNHRKTPVVLVALRSDKEIYEEAIQIFYKLNWFRVKLQNLSGFGSMSRKALESIQNFSLSTLDLEADFVHTPFAHCTSVKAVYLQPLSAAEQKSWAKFCIATFPAVEYLMIMISIGHPSARPSHLSRAEMSGVLALAKNLGAPAKLSKLATSTVREVWFWEAPKGQTLKWTDD
ncbi:hypothetical protein N431DRAFT_396722 [Stipitochalara longipes BDJ]|nr:hypothetical protein N431DRAFT_396722 [Stipitochalara longipes BDJ]